MLHSATLTTGRVTGQRGESEETLHVRQVVTAGRLPSRRARGLGWLDISKGEPDGSDRPPQQARHDRHDPRALDDTAQLGALAGTLRGTRVHGARARLARFRG